jgi:drug/metabolite transporter (DMT)-like permease
MKKQIIGFFIMLSAAIGLASATIFMKTIPQLTTLDPAHVSIWRFIIAGVMIWIIDILHHPGKKRDKPLPVKFLILGFVFGISGFSAVFALDYLPSSIYIIILYFYPSLIVLFSLIAGKPVPNLIWLGLPLTMVGLFLTVFEPGSLLSVNEVGFLITIVNALAIGLYFILSEGYFGKGEPKIRGTRWMLTGALSFSLLWIPFLGFQLPDSALGWLLVAALGIFGTLLPLLLLNIGLQLVGAARGSVIVSLQPVFAILFSVLFLDERLTGQQWLGGVLVIASVLILQLSADRGVVGERTKRRQNETLNQMDVEK